MEAAQPVVAEPGCVACTWHGITIWSRFSWDLIGTAPGFYPLMESIKFCGLTSVPVVRVCGCGSGCSCWPGQAELLARGCWAWLGSAKETGSQTPSDVHPGVLQGAEPRPGCLHPPAPSRSMANKLLEGKKGGLGRDRHRLEGSCTAQRGLAQVLKGALLSVLRDGSKKDSFPNNRWGN